LPVGGAAIERVRYWRKSRRSYVGPSIEKLFLDLLLVIKLCRLVRREKIDIIHAHNYEGALVGILAKLITRKPLLYNAVNLMSDELHTYGFIKPVFLARMVARFLDWFVPLFPDFVITVTQELYDALLRRGVSPRRLLFVPCGVNPEMFDDPNPAELMRRHNVAGRPVVMYTGVNNSFQRIDYLLHAFGKVRQSEPSALLMMVSPLHFEPDISKARQLAESLGLDGSVIWVQSQRLMELPDYLAMANVTVIPRPDVPGHPIKLLNYMASGKPTVCFKGAAKGVTHMEDAVVVADHDWQSLASGILMLLRDPQLAERLGTNARKTVERSFDWKLLSRRVEAVYVSMIEAVPTQVPALQMEEPQENVSPGGR
jgi:glycosyltransferase involved in cell wall biosynthesis